MGFTENLKNEVLNGYLPNEDDAMALAGEDTNVIAEAADEIRAHFCGNKFNICAVINAKSGSCTEDCKFCAQSCHYGGKAEKYAILPAEKLCEKAVLNYKSGVQRFSFVTSGRKLNDDEIKTECEAGRLIHESCPIGLCASNGLLDIEQFKKLRAAGITRYHCNLETSREFFPSVCKTHTYDDKIKTINTARSAGMEICSGGIMGLGEKMLDRIRLAITLRSLHVASVPINILSPIPGTPMEGNKPLQYDEIRKIISTFRFIMPSATILFACGRISLPDKGILALKSGLNAFISGNMLTTPGVNANDDIRIIKNLGFIC